MFSLDIVVFLSQLLPLPKIEEQVHIRDDSRRQIQFYWFIYTVPIRALVAA